MSDDLKWFHSKAEMERWFQVNPNTIKKWTGRDWFPKKTKGGKWPREAVLKAVDAFNARLEEQTTGAELKDEKTRLECQRIRVQIKTEGEKYKQERIKTAGMEGEVWLRSEVLATLKERDTLLKQQVEGARRSLTAKRRSIKDKRWIDSVCDTVIDALAKPLQMK